MHLAVRRNLRRLPKRSPIGTTYVVEGHVVEGHGDEGGQLQVFSRYVVCRADSASIWAPT